MTDYAVFTAAIPVILAELYLAGGVSVSADSL
jgi:hypothetical protein